MRHLIMLAILPLLMVGCERSGSECIVIEPRIEESKEQPVRYDLTHALTVGNHSWLPINLSGKPANRAREILGLLDAFERAHPELVVGSWAVEKQQSSKTTSNEIFGLWVNHRPK